MNYFKTLGGALILIAVIGLEILFSAGIWYMISVGMVPALGDLGASLLALVVAPVIGIMALILFVYSHRLKQLILEWEAENGDTYDEQHKVYYNKSSHTKIITIMKWIVLIADTGGIIFRVLQTNVPLFGQILLFIVFEMLAIAPWFIGTLVHIVSHRPAYAIRRDVAYMRDVVAAQNEMDDLKASRSGIRWRPPTAPRQEIAPAQRQQALPEPSESARTYDVQVTAQRIAPKHGPNTDQLSPFTVAPSETPNGNGASQISH